MTFKYVREMPHSLPRHDPDDYDYYPRYREMDSQELAEAREREIGRIFSDDAQLEDALVESDVPRDIAKVVVWFYRKGSRLITGRPEGYAWSVQLTNLWSAVDATVERYVDQQCRDSIHY